MAEEFKQKAIDYLCKRFKFTEDEIKHGDWNFLFQKYIEMYIAGAVENGIQWHNLRKDPNDLPKNEGSYLVCMEYSYRHTYILNYGQDEYDDEEKMDWYDDESTHFTKEVIAWCEIPQFKE